MLYSIDLNKKRTMIHDAILLNKIKNNPPLETKLFKAIEAYNNLVSSGVLDANSELYFIKYKEAGVEYLSDFEFLDMSFYERISDIKYLSEIEKLQLELNIKKEGIIIPFKNKR